MVFVPCLLMDAANSGRNTDTSVHVLNIPSCAHFASLLHYYCTHDHEQQSGENLPITTSDLNTDEISEHLCGKYENYQGMQLNKSYLLCR